MTPVRLEHAMRDYEQFLETENIEDRLLSSIDLQIKKLVSERDQLKKRVLKLEEAMRQAAELMEKSAEPFDAGCQILRGILHS